ncbi:hypothetical protein Ciccas_006133 [Cichlidogyrus casuarinus]|uniref:Uncharacterized protein n=1 Tax=Cichlidogyrus casuarinus TaxID=1844966 RepID=A0ABD2Q6P6_9PLAT
MLCFWFFFCLFVSSAAEECGEYNLFKKLSEDKDILFVNDRTEHVIYDSDFDGGVVKLDYNLRELTKTDWLFSVESPTRQNVFVIEYGGMQPHSCIGGHMEDQMSSMEHHLFVRVHNKTIGFYTLVSQDKQHPNQLHTHVIYAVRRKTKSVPFAHLLFIAPIKACDALIEQIITQSAFKSDVEWIEDLSKVEIVPVDRFGRRVHTPKTTQAVIQIESSHIIKNPAGYEKIEDLLDFEDGAVERGIYTVDVFAFFSKNEPGTIGIRFSRTGVVLRISKWDTVNRITWNLFYPENYVWASKRDIHYGPYTSFAKDVQLSTANITIVVKPCSECIYEIHIIKRLWTTKKTTSIKGMSIKAANKEEKNFLQGKGCLLRALVDKRQEEKVRTQVLYIGARLFPLGTVEKCDQQSFLSRKGECEQCPAGTFKLKSAVNYKEMLSILEMCSRVPAGKFQGKIGAKEEDKVEDCPSDKPHTPRPGTAFASECFAKLVKEEEKNETKTTEKQKPKDEDSSGDEEAYRMLDKVEAENLSWPFVAICILFCIILFYNILKIKDFFAFS